MAELIHVHSLAELHEWALTWSQTLKPRSLVLLEGPVGAGKTELVRSVSLALGAEAEDIASPSYGILHSYQTAKSERISQVEHVDLYRLEDEEDLESTGFWDLFSAKDSVVFIEWADRLEPGSLPRNWSITRIVIEIVGEHSRSLFVS